jgi:hypothetical protein
MRMHKLTSVVRTAATRTLGQAAAGKARSRDGGMHNRVTKRISAPCSRGQHYACYSINCTCVCAHGAGGK